MYTYDPETKGFLVREARRLSPDWKERSGARYRLNRWREAQPQKGARLTYAGLVRQFVRLCQDPTPFAKIPRGRYINFLSDYFVAHPDGPRGAALRAWRQLKALDAPKTFRARQEANQRGLDLTCRLPSPHSAVAASSGMNGILWPTRDIYIPPIPVMQVLVPRFAPIPDPSGSLDPPRRNPPTALATDSPDPEQRPARARAATHPQSGFTILRRLAGAVLDMADELAASLQRSLHRSGGR